MSVPDLSGLYYNYRRDLTTGSSRPNRNVYAPPALLLLLAEVIYSDADDALWGREKEQTTVQRGTVGTMEYLGLGMFQFGIHQIHYQYWRAPLYAVEQTNKPIARTDSAGVFISAMSLFLFFYYYYYTTATPTSLIEQHHQNDLEKLSNVAFVVRLV